jgi:hypothetical protein
MSEVITAAEYLALNKRKSPRHAEDEAQRAVVNYLYSRYPDVLFFAIPNGEVRPVKTNRNGVTYCPSGARLKALGAKAGVPDLFICQSARLGSDLYHGLFIEMKVKGGKVSPEQKQWIEQLGKKGYLATVCFGFDEAKRLIDLYLKD